MIKGVGVVLIVPIAMDRAFAANANRYANYDRHHHFIAGYPDADPSEGAGAGEV